MPDTAARGLLLPHTPPPRDHHLFPFVQNVNLSRVIERIKKCLRYIGKISSFNLSNHRKLRNSDLSSSLLLLSSYDWEEADLVSEGGAAWPGAAGKQRRGCKVVVALSSRHGHQQEGEEEGSYSWPPHIQQWGSRIFLPLPEDFWRVSIILWMITLVMHNMLFFKHSTVFFYGLKRRKMSRSVKKIMYFMYYVNVSIPKLYSHFGHYFVLLDRKDIFIYLLTVGSCTFSTFIRLFIQLYLTQF